MPRFISYILLALGIEKHRLGRFKRKDCDQVTESCPLNNPRGSLGEMVKHGGEYITAQTTRTKEREQYRSAVVLFPFFRPWRGLVFSVE